MIEDNPNDLIITLRQQLSDLSFLLAKANAKIMALTRHIQNNIEKEEIVGE